MFEEKQTPNSSQIKKTRDRDAQISLRFSNV